MNQIHKNSELNEYIQMLNPDEITDELIECFDDFRRDEERQQKSCSRHIYNISISDAETSDLIVNPQKLVEDIVINNEMIDTLLKNLEVLSPTQKRRVMQHYFDGLTVMEISEIENVKHQAISKSINLSIKKLKEFCTDF